MNTATPALTLPCASQVGSYKGKRVFGQQFDDIKKRLKQYPYIATSLFFGSNQDNGYDTSALPSLMVKVRDCNAAETKGDTCNRHVWQGGADMPRGMQLHRNSKGIWKVKNCAGMVTAPPAPAVVDDGDDI